MTRRAPTDRDPELAGDSAGAAGACSYNDLPTVRLLDQSGALLGPISQREAARLLRRGQAELVLELAQQSPAVRLSIPRSQYETLPASSASFLHARQGALYGNVSFQSPQGQTMFHGDSEKALWYLNRGLVEVVSQDPPVLRFRFTPGGSGHVGDDYYLAEKVNRCVVCGAREGLSRHHVVPRVYRRHLPAEVKDHSHHDVLLLCLACHEKYEAAADALKAELGQEFGVPLHGRRGERDPTRNRAVKLALALIRHGEQIPLPRQEEMRRLIADWAGKSPLTDADMEAIARTGPGPESEALAHGRHVIAQTKDVQAFLRRWREHFLRAMQPRFLPEHWNVDRPVGLNDPTT